MFHAVDNSSANALSQSSYEESGFYEIMRKAKPTGGAAGCMAVIRSG
jgi:hypothetical protein